MNAGSRCLLRLALLLPLAASLSREGHAAEPPRAAAALVPQLMHTRGIESIAFSPDGTLAVTGGDASVKVWDVATLTLLRTLHGHTEDVYAVAFLPDGRRVLSAGEDHRLILWDAQSGARLRTERGHEAWITSMVVNATGQLAIAADLQGTVKLWDLDDGGELLSFQAHPEGSVRLALATAARLFATSGKDRVVRLWSITERNLESRTLEDPDFGDALSIRLALTPDGRRLLTAAGKRVQVWDVARGVVERRLDLPDVLDLRLLDGGRRALFATARGGVVEWDLDRGKRLRALPHLDDEAVLALDVSADGRRLLSASSLPEDSHYDLKLWDLGRGEPLAAIDNNRSQVWSAAFTPDGQRLLSACGDGVVRVWDPSTMQLERTLEVGAAPTWLAPFPDGKSVVVGTWGGRLRALSLSSGLPTVDFADSGEEAFSVNAVAISPDGNRVAATQGHLAALWDASGRLLGKLEGHSDDLHALAFFPDGKRLLSAAQDGTLRVWDVEARRELVHLGSEEQNLSLFAAAVSPDGLRVAGAGRKGAIFVWEVAAPERAPLVLERPRAEEGDQGDKPDEPDEIDALAFSPDGARLVAGGHGLAVRVWDLRARKLLRTLDGHDNQVTSVAFSPDGRFVLSGSYDESTRLTRADTGESVAFLGRHDDWLIYSAAGWFDASRRGGQLVAAVEQQRPYRIDQLALVNNRPDRLLDTMGLGTPAVVDYYRGRFERRARKLGVALDKLAAGFSDVPVVSGLEVAAEKGAAAVSFELADPRGALLSYNVYVNDVPLFGPLGKPASGARMRVSERVALGGGRNKIEVGALGGSGAEALRPFRVVDGGARPRGDLWFLGFGVSRYRDRRLDLRFAHKDALDLADVLRAGKGGYRAVHATVFVDEQVTVEAVRRARELLRPAGVDDTVVLFVAGHGLHGGEGNAEYFYATHEVDPARPAETAAPFELVEELLSGIAPRRKLLLMDTCESGERDEQESAVTAALPPGARGMRARAARPLAIVAAPGTPGWRPPLRDRERYIETSLARRSGAVVLSSSRGAEASYEFEELQNGAFTEALLLALTSGEADTDRDGAVSTDELRGWVARRVAALTRDRQHPTVDRDNLEARFGLPVVRAARAIVTRKDRGAARATSPR